MNQSPDKKQGLLTDNGTGFGEKQQRVAPEMQEQADIFIANGMAIIHNPKVSDGLLSKILKSQNRIEAIAEAIVTIINRLFDSAKESRQSLSNETLVHGSNFLLGELINLAETAGMQKLSDEQRTEALQRGVGMFLSDAVKQGRLTKEQLVGMSEQAKQTPEGQKILQQGPSNQKEGV
jgi:hypothetical protein